MIFCPFYFKLTFFWFTKFQIKANGEKKAFNFDSEHERKRKEQMKKLFDRTQKDIEEEQMLLNELKKIEARKKERDRKTQDLQKLISQADQVSRFIIYVFFFFFFFDFYFAITFNFYFSMEFLFFSSTKQTFVFSFDFNSNSLSFFIPTARWNTADANQLT